MKLTPKERKKLTERLPGIDAEIEAILAHGAPDPQAAQKIVELRREKFSIVRTLSASEKKVAGNC